MCNFKLTFNLVFFTYLFFITSYAQENLTNEKLFLFNMRVNNYNLTDITNEKAGYEDSPDFFTKYIKSFYSSDLFKVSHNEFEKEKFYIRKKEELNEKISNLSFDNEYIFRVTTKFGEYNFQSNSFPILLNEKEVPFNSLWNFINIKDFELELKMSPDEASEFIEKQHLLEDKPKRSLCLEFVINFTNLPTIEDTYKNNYRDLKVYVRKINITSSCEYSFYIETLKPKFDYFDKVNAFRLPTYSDTFYYDNDWKDLFSQKNAKYYRVVNYENGQIDNPVKTYYISEKLQNVTFYDSFWPRENVKSNGKVTWYYENGVVKENIFVLDNKWHGQYVKYWETGELKEQGNYVDGKLEGCIEKYLPNGDCTKSTFNEYINGKEIWSTKCKCELTENYLHFNKGGIDSYSLKYNIPTYPRGIGKFTKKTSSKEITINGLEYFEITETLTDYPGANTSKYYLRMDSTGLYRMDNGVQTEYLLYKLPIHIGDEWVSINPDGQKTKYKAESVESVKVNNEKRNCIMLTYSGSNSKGWFSGEIYYLKDFGMVKQIYKRNLLNLEIDLIGST